MTEQDKNRIKDNVKRWLENYADRYIILKSDGKYQMVTFKKTMISDLMKHIDECNAEYVTAPIPDLAFDEVEKETEIQKKVLSVIERIFCMQVHLKDKLKEDLGMDSLDEVEVTLELEREFNVSISDEEIYKYFENISSPTIQDVVDGIILKLKHE